MTIRWSDIEAECGDYKAGFVATFTKYQGQPTDEKAVPGHTVKVTAASFARHMGIAKSTFEDWLKKGGFTFDNTNSQWIGGEGDARPLARSHSQLTSDVRRAIRHAPEALIAAVDELPEAHAVEIANKIVRRQKERRLTKLVEQGADFSEAGRKERRAATAEALEPLRNSLRALGCMVVVTTLEQAAEELRNVVGIDDDERREIDAAVDEVILARTEMHMKLEVS